MSYNAVQALGICSLEQRRIVVDLVMCYKIVNNLVDLDCERFFKFADSVSIHTGGHSKKL